MTTVLGTVHGRTIELGQDLGLPDGQQVEITVRPIAPSKSDAWGDGLRRCAGSLANSWTEEDERILKEIYQDRKRDTRQELAD